jgi:hypothetical protein
MPFGSSFDQAAFVICAGLAAIVIVQVNNDAGQILFKTLQLASGSGADPVYESGAAFNVVIAVNLDLHKRSFFN